MLGAPGPAVVPPSGNNQVSSLGWHPAGPHIFWAGPTFSGRPPDPWPTGTRELPAPDVTCPLQSGVPWFPRSTLGKQLLRPRPRTGHPSWRGSAGPSAGHVLGRAHALMTSQALAPASPSSAAQSPRCLFQTGLRRGAQMARLLDWPARVGCELVGAPSTAQMRALVTLPSPPPRRQGQAETPEFRVQESLSQGAETSHPHSPPCSLW